MPKKNKNKTPQKFSVKIEKFVHGGQCLATLDDGRKVFVWGALPGEEVEFFVTKKRRDYVEGIACDVIKPSELRIKPPEENYLNTSPWQILGQDKEGHYKAEIVKETFSRAGVDIPEPVVIEPDAYYSYRNKMEYSFFGDEEGLHLALYSRGTHRKQVVESTIIAMPQIDEVANRIVEVLSAESIRASSLKTLILRSSQNGEVVASLFVKNDDFPKINGLHNVCAGIKVVYSNPKSPASVVTKELYGFGETTLSDEIAGKKLQYDVLSFFQVNLGEFEKAVTSIKNFVGDQTAVDMFCGVGSIGVVVESTDVFVESDKNNLQFLNNNVQSSSRVIHTKSEEALDYIDPEKALILDPPRAGLHKNLVEKINEIKPPKIAYLSCNPVTQARDLALLKDNYEFTGMEVYNFFPRTPHIETLAKLVRK